MAHSLSVEATPVNNKYQRQHEPRAGGGGGGEAPGERAPIGGAPGRVPPVLHPSGRRTNAHEHTATQVRRGVRSGTARVRGVHVAARGAEAPRGVPGRDAEPQGPGAGSARAGARDPHHRAAEHCAKAPGGAWALALGVLRAMRANTNVRALDLSNDKLSDAIGGSLGKMLEQNKTLRSLNLGFNELTHQTLGVIGRALKVNAVLTTVVLESNPIMVYHKERSNGSSGSSNATTSGDGAAITSNSSGAGGSSNIEAFTSSIASTSSLTALNLFSTHMTYEEGRTLAQAFAKNSSIISLEVGGNSLLQSDIALFASRLRKNLARMDAAESKSAEIHSEMKARAEVREQEEWERARVKTEEDVRRLMEIDALDKKYREQLEVEKKPKCAKGKKGGW